MSSQADGEFRYIAHYVDHFSKFHVIWPIMHKTAAEVAIGLRYVILSIVKNSCLKYRQTSVYCVLLWQFFQHISKTFGIGPQPTELCLITT